MAFLKSIVTFWILMKSIWFTCDLKINKASTIIWTRHICFTISFFHSNNNFLYMIKLYVPNAIYGPIVIYPNIWGNSFWILIYFNLCQNGKGRIVVILLSQTTHVLEHLNISCFKYLKKTSKKKEMVLWMKKIIITKKADVNCLGKHNFGLVCVQKYHQIWE